MGMQHRVLRDAMKGALRLFYPPQCLACGEPVAASGDGAIALCAGCWREARFITGTCCDGCGVPLPGDGGGAADDGLLCDHCLQLARPWERARAALVYSGTGRQLALTLKHGDRPDMAPQLAGWMHRAAAPLVRPGMIVAPVPLHLRRLLRRRYNQAELLSARIAESHSLTHLPDLLRRTRHTPAQDHRDAAARFENMENALAVRPRHLAALRGCPVLLVDDVMASGATLTAATEALLAAGSGPVFIVVLARAVRDD